jgi:hypothetical protein
MGPANPHYKNGRYSKYLPDHVREGYERARTDPRLLSLTDEIAVLDQRLGERLRQVGQGDSVALWSALREALATWSEALGAGDMTGMNTAFATMQRLITEGGDQAAAWGEIARLWETRGKLVATEVKTLQSMQQMVTQHQQMLILGRMVDTFTRAVQAHTDSSSGRKILHDVMVEFSDLTTRGER